MVVLCCGTSVLLEVSLKLCSAAAWQQSWPVQAALFLSILSMIFKVCSEPFKGLLMPAPRRKLVLDLFCWEVLEHL